jgi:alpha-L-fucosidase
MDGGDAGQAQYKKIDPDFINKYATNNFDPAPVSYENYIEKKAKPQMREILTKFPNLVEIWYDYPNQMNFQQSFEFYKLAYEYQPKCFINSRVGNDLGDMLTAGDNQIPTEINSKYKTWETPGTLNDTWGFKSYDNNWKSHKEMLFWIVEIASKGGNYLLNVGPDGNGNIPEESVKILKGIGAWMRINSESIYGTGKWTSVKEGPTKTDIKGRDEDGNILNGSGKKINFDFSFTSEDFWFTAKDNYVYVISLTTPISETIRVRSLFDCRQKIESIKVLGNNVSLKWNASGDNVNITLPLNRKTDEPGFVLKVKFK